MNWTPQTGDSNGTRVPYPNPDSERTHVVYPYPDLNGTHVPYPNPDSERIHVPYPYPNSKGTHVPYPHPDSSANSNSRLGLEGYYENRNEPERHHRRSQDRDRAHDSVDDEYLDYSESRSRRDGRGHRHGHSRSHEPRSGSPGDSSYSALGYYNQYPDSSRCHRHGAFAHDVDQHEDTNFTFADTVTQRKPALILWDPVPTQVPLLLYPRAGAEGGVPGSASERWEVRGEDEGDEGDEGEEPSRDSR
ncbi:hypothetical protein DL765_008425 [Monosporascus sp. GIB2]|nr:hypothetical protein DL765_008425 [Monosporascus sp. GIB2]